jgi:hypothetical protein
MCQLYVGETYLVIELRTDAVSAITVLLNRFHKKVTNHDFREMHEGVITEIESMKKIVKKKLKHVKL